MRDRTPEVIKQIKEKNLDVHPRREAFQLFGVFTEEECKFLIEATEKIGTFPFAIFLFMPSYLSCYSFPVARLTDV